METCRVTCPHGSGHIFRRRFFQERKREPRRRRGDALIEIDDARLGPPPHPCPSRLFELTRLHVDQRGFAYIQITLPMDVSYANNYPVIIHVRIDGTIPCCAHFVENSPRFHRDNNGDFKYERSEFDRDTIVAPLCWDRTAFARMPVIFIMHIASAMSKLPIRP